jgi:hypothetical protein
LALSETDLKMWEGLFAPDMIVGPYEQTLNTMDVRSRREWAQRTQAQMETMLPTAATRCVILAGARYMRSSQSVGIRLDRRPFFIS